MSSYPFISRPSRFSRSDYEDRPQCIVSVHAIARAELYKPFLFVAPGRPKEENFCENLVSILRSRSSSEAMTPLKK